MARGALMLKLILPFSTVPTATPMPMATPPTATDTVWPELLDTPEPPPPSLPGAPRDLERGALTPSQDTSLTELILSCQCPTPPTAMDLLDIPLVSFTPELPPPSSTCPGCTKMTASNLFVTRWLNLKYKFHPK